jgi:hypothetical protein
MVLALLTWIGTGCWCVCFWWMYRISSRQNAMLKELHKMMHRIETLSQAGHELIQDVHPQVSEIKDHVESVKDAISSDTD